MKSVLKLFFAANLALGFMTFGSLVRAQAGSDSSSQPSLSTTESPTPATMPTHHGHKARKSKPVGDSSTVPDPALAGTESPAPETTPALHGRKAKNTKSTADQGLAPQSSPVATPIIKSEAATTAVPDYEFNAVVITGTKTKLKVLDSPAAVNVISRSKIEQKRVTYIDDALIDLPGVQVSRVAQTGQSVTVTMRGIPGYEKNLVLLDGFTLNQPNNGRVFWNMVPTQLVDHIEIVRGPFSALYGKCALGGVINIITKEPEGQSFNVGLTADTTNTRLTTVNFQKKVSDLFSFYLGLEDTTINGYTDHQFVQASAVTNAATQTVVGFVQTTNTKGVTVYNVGEIARSVLRNDNVSAKLYFKPAPEHVITFLANYSIWSQPTENQTGELGETWLRNSITGARVSSGVVSLAGTGKNVKISDSLFYTAPGVNSFYPDSLQYKGKLSDWASLSTNLTYWGHYNVLAASLPSSITALSGQNTGGNISTSWEVIGNVQADLKLPVRNNLTVGTAYDGSHLKSTYRNYDFWGDLDNYEDIPGAYTGIVATTKALFLQDEWNIFHGFTAFVGARTDWWDTSKNIIWLQGQGQTTYPDRQAVNFAPKLSLVYKIFGDQGSLRTSVGKAYNPPTPAQLTNGGGVTSSTTITLPNPYLTPENDIAWEFGGSYQFPIKTTFSATYFDNRLSNLIYTNSVINGTVTTNQWINAGAARILGVETEAKQTITSYLDGDVNYTRVEGKFNRNDAVQNSVGKRIPYISRDVFNFGLDFKWKKLDFAPSATYHSKQFVTADNSDTVNGVQGAYDAYTTFSAKVGYRLPTGQIYAGVENIFNNRYYLQYLNPGRTFNVGTKIDIL